MLFISLQFSYSNEFVIKNFAKAPNDATAINQKYKRLNSNDEVCAIIKIRSDLEGVKFGAVNGIEDQLYINGEYFVYVSPGEKKLYIMKEGFIKKEYLLPISIEKATVYKMQLTGSDTYPIVINTDPNNLEVLLDGKKEQSGVTIPDIEPGSHTLDIEYPGYAEVHDTIYISKNKISFYYQLEALKQIPIRITTTPEGANLMVNNRMENNTPSDVFVFPGKVRMLITLNKYGVIDTTVKVLKSTKEVHFNLQNNTGNFTINSNTPGIELLIDNKPAKLGPNEIIKGKHTLNAKAYGYYNHDTVFSLAMGENIVKQINLKRMTGDLQVTAKPVETKLELIKETYNSYNGKTTEDIVESWQGTKSVENIPTGSYVLRATCPGHTAENRNISIENQKTSREDFSLLIVSREKGTKGKSVGFSALMPGTGQLYSQQKRGWIYMPLFIGTLGTSYIFHTDVRKYNDARDAYLNATTDISTYRDKMDETYEKAVSSAKTRNLLVYTAGAVYLTCLVDAIIFGGKETKQQAGIGKYLNNFNLTCVPIDGIPTYGFSYKF